MVDLYDEQRRQTQAMVRPPAHSLTHQFCVQFSNVYECDTLINAFVQKIFSTIVDKLSVCLCVSVRRAHTTENREICEKNPQQKQPNDIELHILWKTAG